MCRSAVNDGSCSPWVRGNQIRDNKSQFGYIFKMKTCSFTNARNVDVKGEIAIK